MPRLAVCGPSWSGARLTTERIPSAVNLVMLVVWAVMLMLQVVPS